MLIRKAVRLMLGPHRLFITNLVSSGVLMGLGDWAVQQAVKRTEKTQQKTDWPRTGRMFAVGFVFGPMLHVWYKYLDLYLPLASISTVLKKVVVDQGVGAPIFLAYFFAANGYLEGKTASEISVEFRTKFLSIYAVECVFWPIVQVFNFYFLPNHLRVIYVCTVAGVYDAFLSFVKYEPSSEAFLFLKPKD